MKHRSKVIVDAEVFDPERPNPDVRIIVGGLTGGIRKFYLGSTRIYRGDFIVTDHYRSGAERKTAYRPEEFKELFEPVDPR